MHHGDGTQDIFKSDKDVLFISTHVYDDGNFYPHQSGSSKYVGSDQALGYTINIGWNIYRTRRLVDEDYVYLFETVLVPIIKDFNPDLIMVSSGFDSCRGDPLADMLLSPRAYYHMITRLQMLQSKMVVCMEGGYNLDNVKESSYSVMMSLLGVSDSIHDEAVKSIAKTKKGKDKSTYNDLLENKNWRLASYEYDKIVPQDFVIEQCKDVILALRPYWQNVDWQDMDKKIYKSQEQRQELQKHFLDKKLPNLDYIGMYSFCLGFPELKPRDYIKMINRLKKAKIEGCSLMHDDHSKSNRLTSSSSVCTREHPSIFAFLSLLIILI